jgi:hypothetical protein
MSASGKGGGEDGEKDKQCGQVAEGVGSHGWRSWNLLAWSIARPDNAGDGIKFWLEAEHEVR